jgi:glycosyltransferase involved in cell wall biosynthesis
MNVVGGRTKLYVLIPNLNMGGAERVVVTILRHLDRAKFDCSLVVLANADGALASFLSSNIPIISLNKSRVLTALPALLWLLWRDRPNLVFSNLSHLNLLLALVRIAMPTNMKIIARESSVISTNTSQYRAQFFWRYLYKTFYHHLDRVICQSYVMQKDIVDNFGVPSKKTTIISNPVDVRYLKAQAKLGAEHIPKTPKLVGFRFVFVGGLRPEKRVDRLLHALSALSSGSLEIVGDGPERARLQGLCKELALLDRVRFLGFQSNPYGWIQTADALILSSDYEGAPNVVLEALALQTPVISTPAVGGVCEMLKGQQGCVVADALSAASLAKAIQIWIDMKHKKVSKQAVNAYRAPQIIRQYEAQFLDLVS